MKYSNLLTATLKMAPFKFSLDRNWYFEHDVRILEKQHFLMTDFFFDKEFAFPLLYKMI